MCTCATPGKAKVLLLTVWTKASKATYLKGLSANTIDMQLLTNRLSMRWLTAEVIFLILTVSHENYIIALAMAPVSERACPVVCWLYILALSGTDYNHKVLTEVTSF